MVFIQTMRSFNRPPLRGLKIVYGFYTKNRSLRWSNKWLRRSQLFLAEIEIVEKAQ